MMPLVVARPWVVKNNQQLAGVRLMMAMGGSRGDKNINDNVDNVQHRLPNTQQPAIDRGGEAATKMSVRKNMMAVGG